MGINSGIRAYHFICEQGMCQKFVSNLQLDMRSFGNSLAELRSGVPLHPHLIASNTTNWKANN
jgi:hypothetical protein